MRHSERSPRSDEPLIVPRVLPPPWGAPHASVACRSCGSSPRPRRNPEPTHHVLHSQNQPLYFLFLSYHFPGKNYHCTPSASRNNSSAESCTLSPLSSSILKLYEFRPHSGSQFAFFLTRSWPRNLPAKHEGKVNLMRIARLIFSALLLLGIAAIPSATRAEVAVGVSIRVGPPVLPVYAQPICPVAGYLWVPGYWAYGPDGYYWVPGAWVAPPAVGLLWTPGYWAFTGGFYRWNAGYWGPQVGFYGGINYGFGYTGVGYAGGYWRGNNFYYNRAVTNVNVNVVHNTYNTSVHASDNHVSFNGGRGGINARPTAAQEQAARERHVAATSGQQHLESTARANRNQFASVNHGRPAVTATTKAATFKSSAAPTRTASRERTTSKPSEAKPRTETKSANTRARTAESSPRTETKPAPTREPKTESKPRTETRSASREPKAGPKPRTETKPAPTREPKTESKPRTETRSASREPKAEPKPRTETKPAATYQPKAAPTPKPEKSATTHETKSAPKPRTEPKPAATHQPSPQSHPQPQKSAASHDSKPAQQHANAPREENPRKPS